MIYECDQCSKALPPGVMACPNCEEEFGEAVPADAEVPKRGFSAQPRSSGAGVSEASFLDMPGQGSYYSTDPDGSPEPRNYSLAALGQQMSPNKSGQGEIKSGEEEVLTISGKGDKKSKPFKVGERWRIEWEAKDENRDVTGVTYIHVNTVKDKEQFSSCGGVDGSNKDSSEEYGAGHYFLDVSTTFQSWYIRVIDYR